MQTESDSQVYKINLTQHVIITLMFATKKGMCNYERESVCMKICSTYLNKSPLRTGLHLL